MLNFLRGAFCPSCRRLLYTLSRDEDATHWIHKGAPLQEDALGYFVTCPSCRRRVDLRQSAGLPGWGFEVDR